MKNAAQHIPYPDLVDLVEGRVSPDQRDALLQHLASCDQCTAERDGLQRTISFIGSNELDDAPEYVIVRAVRLLRPRSVPTQPTLRERVLAAVRFDSASLTPAFGVRSRQAPARQLLFSAAGYDVDVRIVAAESGGIISGQLLGPETEGEVELHGPNTQTQTALNALGEWTLPPVAAGDYTIILRLDTVDIELPPLEIG